MTEYFMPISELSKKLDIPAHTLRYWEKEFPALVMPTTGAGGRRYYRPEAVESVTRLKKYLYADGYTIDGVKKLIAQNQFGAADVKEVKPHEDGGVPKKADIKAAIKLLEEASGLLA